MDQTAEEDVRPLCHFSSPTSFSPLSSVFSPSFCLFAPPFSPLSAFFPHFPCFSLSFPPFQWEKFDPPQFEPISCSSSKVLLSFYSGNRKLEVQLPRFLLDRSYSLRDVLQTLDITRVFQDDAEINMGDHMSKLEQVTSCLLQ